MKIAIIGRPNVGKSTLFNKICKRKTAIVAEEEGVTRDRIYVDVNYDNKKFTLIDTAGIDPKSDRIFNNEVIEQAKLAIVEADVVVMVVDSRCDITDLDDDIAKVLRSSKKPIILAVNKIDNPNNENDVFKFVSLGIDEMIAVSAIQNFNVALLVEKAILKSKTPLDEKDQNLEQMPRVSIIGRPNVGKSTILNYLLNEKRSVVSDVAGTTRDNVDARVTYNKKEYLFIDTAGIRRKNKEKCILEKFAFVRTKRAIDNADVCLLVVDAKEGITAQEKKIFQAIEEEGKGCIILVNKWDLVTGFRMEECIKSIHKVVPSFSHFPIIFTEAINGRNLDEILFVLINQVFNARKQKVTTGVLNKFVENALKAYTPPAISGKRLKIYYMVQKDSKPPTFKLFVNSTKIFAPSYKRYLLNRLRDTYGFIGAPIRLEISGKSKASNPYIGNTDK
jgi:GTPase